MKTAIIIVACLLAASVYYKFRTNTVDPSTLAPGLTITEREKRLKVGMHENEVVQHVGQPTRILMPASPPISKTFVYQKEGRTLTVNFDRDKTVISWGFIPD